MKNYHWVKYFHVNSSLSSKFWKSVWMKKFFEGSTSLIFYQGKRKNLINWAETKYSICNINLALDPSNCSSEKVTTYFDFRRSYFKGACLYQKYFWRTRVQTIEQKKNTWKVSETCWLFLQIVLLLNTRYSSKSDVEDVSDNCTANFVRENNFESFEKLFIKVDNIKIKNIGRQKSEKCTFTSWKLLPTLASWNFQITNTK